MSTRVERLRRSNLWISEKERMARALAKEFGVEFEDGRDEIIEISD
jgi:hypothetical protein